MVAKDPVSPRGGLTLMKYDAMLHRAPNGTWSFVGMTIFLPTCNRRRRVDICQYMSLVFPVPVCANWLRRFGEGGV